MATFERIVSLGALPEHQEGHREVGWTIVEERDEGWEAEKEISHPERLKAGESPVREVLFSKREWNLIAK